MITQQHVNHRSGVRIGQESHVDVGRVLERLERDLKRSCGPEARQRQFAKLGVGRI